MGYQKVVFSKIELKRLLSLEYMMDLGAFFIKSTQSFSKSLYSV